MAKVAIATLDEAEPAGSLDWVSGDAQNDIVLAGERDPIHVHRHRLNPGGSLSINAMPVDQILYVLEGQLMAGEQPLNRWSSVIIERGADFAALAGDDGAELISFHAAKPTGNDRSGGHVRLLPTENVPRADNLGNRPGLSGGMHANGCLETCEVWLHENGFANPQPVGGIHSHSEDEVIFVVEGTMLLGNRSYGPGTALAVAADTMYGFGVGEGGMRFINFRPGRPGLIKAEGGHTIDEVAFWEQLGEPQYLDAVA